MLGYCYVFVKGLNAANESIVFGLFSLEDMFEMVEIPRLAQWRKLSRVHAPIGETKLWLAVWRDLNKAQGHRLSRDKVSAVKIRRAIADLHEFFGLLIENDLIHFEHAKRVSFF